MNDPRDISTAPAGAHADAPDNGLRPLLWLLLTIGIFGNIVVSAIGANIIGSVVFGLITLASAAALITQHYRNRR